MFFGRSDGFLMLLPLLSMVFDGSGPLVKRCDGFDGSLWSKTWYLLLPPSAEITFLPTFYFAANGSHIYLMQIASCAKVK